MKMSISALNSRNADMLILATQPGVSRKKFGCGIAALPP